jgi:2',3'-cyclic-nucleotide 2'-phosphodiesterase
MKILYVGDIMGSAGRTAFARVVGKMRSEAAMDLVVVNGENAAAGRGLTPALAEELFAAGADLITLGDHTWDQRELHKHLDVETRLLRPANYAPGCPGRGIASVETRHGRVSVLVLQGRVFMDPMDCPFRCADEVLSKRGDLGKVILAEIHAEATSEKNAMGLHLDGRVTAVVGTHTHVQTADERLLPLGTAFITDLGMTGPENSVIGMDSRTVLPRFLTGMPTKFEVASGGLMLQGALIDADPATGRARRIKRVRERAE